MTHDNDLIRRVDAMQATQVGPSDEWAKATKSGYNQAATDIAMNIMKLPAAPASVRVKPLVWENVPTGYGPETYEAVTATGFYQVFTDEDSSCGAVFAEFATDRNHFGTTSARSIGRVNGFREAKAAAQADYAARIMAALDVTAPDVAQIRAWQGMNTAPKGAVTESVGCRGASEWFLGRVAPEFKDSRPPFIVIRRRAWPQEDSWECAGETYYVPRFFDAWAEIFPDTQEDQ